MPKLKKIYQLIVNQIFIYSSFLLAGIIIYGCNTKSVQDKLPENQNEILSKVGIRQSDVDFTLVLESDTMSRSLAFYKHKDSSRYHHMNYQFYSEKEIWLKDELALVNELWSIAEDSIELNLKSLMLGYPLEYKDVLQNQIIAFRDNPEWNDINQEETFQNYKLMRDIMKTKSVYYPLDSLLETKGMAIQEFSTEKHGYVPREELKKLGFDETLKIPVPFMVWIGLKKN
ncbi:hypothetical protein [Fulvivirga lutimaris]|uniref:hypothetical protein n=1 Tax=Fulvivirga lutimaris TaxID=1819566 RepID=UPI0012BD1316|nr:hypothetical protein [Fulvivirga lutimaris]MTI41057.1 hypothetical protein [Fulvivirga lutimaris]